MSKKKTHEQYVAEVYNINRNIEVVGVYNGADVSILHKCKVDGYEWYSQPRYILRGHGCRQCQNNAKRKTHEQYVIELNNVAPNIQALETYVGDKVKILHRCLIDGHEWKVRPHQVLAGHGCPMCDRNNRAKTHEQYILEVSEINPNIIVLDKYVNNKTKIRYRCKHDGNEFSARPDSILYGGGCPECCMSHGEKEIYNYLFKNNIEFEYQYVFDDCRNVLCLPFDFYLPMHNLCIEYDGEQHFHPVDYFGGEDGFKKRKHNDEIKTSFCITNNIELLRIAYYQDTITVLDDFFTN